MSFATAELVRDARELPHLLCREQSARHLSAYHLHPGLPLAIDTPAQPEGPKLIVRKLTIQVQPGLPPEQFDIFADSAIVLLLSNLEFGQDSGGHRYSSL
jgi:hypothetical protein